MYTSYALQRCHIFHNVSGEFPFENNYLFFAVELSLLRIFEIYKHVEESDMFVYKYNVKFPSKNCLIFVKYLANFTVFICRFLNNFPQLNITTWNMYTLVLKL